MASSLGTDDRVQFLCAQVASTTQAAELQVLLPQLQAAIHEHITFVRAIAEEVVPETFGKHVDI